MSSPLSFVIRHQLVDNIHARYEHSPTTIAFQAERIQYFLGVFSSLNSAKEIIVFVCDKVSAGEASHRDYHFFIHSLYR